MNDYHYDDWEFPLFLKIIAGVLGIGFTLLMLAVFAKIAVDIWTGSVNLFPGAGGCAG